MKKKQKNINKTKKTYFLKIIKNSTITINISQKKTKDTIKVFFNLNKFAFYLSIITH